MPKHTDSISDFKVSDAVSYGNDLSYWFMSWDAWETDREDSMVDVKISAAQPAGMDFDEHLACLRLRSFSFHDLPRGVDLCDDSCFHFANLHARQCD
jgi:hypothetical protein